MQLQKLLLILFYEILIIKLEKMNIYELITPSDPITFKTDDDKVAFTCALVLGSGKAGCANKTTGESLPTMIMFSKDPEKDINDFLGSSLSDFSDANILKIAECFKSFAYGSVSDRETFDDACEAISDPGKLTDFKMKHEDKNRTSLSKWVKAAWEYGEHMEKLAKAKNK